MTPSTVSKGSTVLATLRFVEEAFGAELRLSVLAALPGALRDRLVAIEPTAELPYAELLALWRAADGLLHTRDPLWVERSGAFSIASTGVQLYRGILRKRSPHEFLTQSVSLFQLYYYPGDMDVVDEDAGRAVLRLSGFDSQDVLFCRRQTGGLRQALLQAGGEALRVKHVRCAHVDDAFCEWELRWHLDGKEGQESRAADPAARPPG